jgi:hypothetical protein
VRHTIGYDRWETDQEFVILQSIHDDLRLYINFFQPSFKLIAFGETYPAALRRDSIRL